MEFREAACQDLRQTAELASQFVHVQLAAEPGGRIATGRRCLLLLPRRPPRTSHGCHMRGPTSCGCRRRLRRQLVLRLLQLIFPPTRRDVCAGEALGPFAHVPVAIATAMLGVGPSCSVGGCWSFRELLL